MMTKQICDELYEAANNLLDVPIWKVSSATDRLRKAIRAYQKSEKYFCANSSEFCRHRG